MATVAGDGIAAGAVYRPPLLIVPQATPLHPAPLTLQVTAIFELPVTLALNCCVVPVAMESPLGLTITATTFTTVTFTAADLVESAALTAVTVTPAGEGAIGGAE